MTEKEKEEYIKKLFEYLDKNMLEINTSIMAERLHTKNPSVNPVKHLTTKNKVDIDVSKITLEPCKIFTRDVGIQENVQYLTKSKNVGTPYSSRSINENKSKEETKVDLKALRLNKPNAFKIPFKAKESNIDRNKIFVDRNYFLAKASNR